MGALKRKGSRVSAPLFGRYPVTGATTAGAGRLALTREVQFPATLRV